MASILSRSQTLVLCFLSFLTLQAQDYSHPEYKQWTEAFKKGDLEQSITIAEKNLVSNKPHHFALLAWYTAHHLKGDITTAIPQLNSSHRAGAIMLKEIHHFDEEQLSIEAYKKYTSDQLKKISDPYGLYQWSDLVRNIDPLQSYSLMVHGLQHYGEYFRFVWSIDNLSMNNMDVFKQLHADLKSGIFDGFPTAKDFLAKVSVTPFQVDLNDLKNQEAFLEKYPNDPIAIRFKANELQDLKRFDEAAKLYLQSWEIDPYYVFGLSLKDAANAYAKAGNMDLALSLTDRYASLYYPNSKELKSSTEWAKTLLSLGRNSEARAVLEDKKEAYNADPSFHLSMGQLERASKRHDFALKHFEQAYRIGPKTEAYAAALVDAYITSEKPAAALEVINRLEGDRQLPLDFYFKKASVFENAEDYEEAYAVRKESTEQYPASSWHWNNYAYISNKTERHDEAYKAILKSLSLANPSAWASARLYDYTKASFDETKALANLEEYAKAYPWNEYLWKEYASKFKQLDKKEVIYRKAVETSGEYFYPYKNLIDEYLKANDWEKATAAWAEAAAALSLPNDVKELTYYESEIIRRKGQQEKLSITEIDQALDAMNRYARITGAKDGYWYRDMSAFMIYKNDKETSALYLDSGLMVEPDSDPILSKIRNDNLKEYGVGKFSRKLYEYVQRDPYDIERYKDAVDFHVKWGGSPLAAIVLSQKARELIPDDYSKISSLEVMAYGKLGDNAKDFELRYAKDNVISSSERYIGWYNASRHNVWKGSSKITVDPKTTTATIQFPDGTVAQRQDDVVTGRVKMLQVGNAYIKADYNSEGSLTSLDASNGRNVQIEYDEKNKVNQISTGEGNQLSFEYNKEGKTSMMALKGVGHIKITYDPYGEMDEVKSFDESGNEAGTQIAMKITSSFQELNSLTDVLQKAQTLTDAQLPDLGIADGQHDALSNSWYSLLDELYAKENNKKRVEWLKKAVELALYLKDNTHINADYAQQCADVIIETRDELRLHKNAKTVLYGPQLADVFHELLLKTRRNGVALEWWNEWIDTQEWLQKEKQAETKLTPYRIAIEKVQEKFKEQPVELLSTSEWLPKSMLQNAGYWKKFAVNDIMDEQYQDNLKINVLFKRANGDIVIGTNKGLLVRHHGYWDHFAFNPLQSAFERDLPVAQIKASSDILSITETESQLILGTSDGVLVLMGESYMGKIKQRYSQLDGLPVSAILSVAAMDDNIYLGTSEGLLVLKDNQVTPHEQITAPVNFIHQFNIVDNGYEASISKITIGTDQQLWLIEGGEVKAYTNYKVDDALVNNWGELFILKNKSVMRWDNEVFVELYGNVITTDADQVYGLAMVPVTEVTSSAFTDDMYDEYDLEGPQSELAPAVLTDMGMSLYHDRHFEHFYLPLRNDRTPQARKYAGEKNGFAIYTGDDVYVFELDQVKTVTDGAVHDILSSDELKKTFVAKATGLYFVDHNDPELSLQLIDYVYPDALALDKSNRLIVNDGAQVLRYTWLKDGEYFDPEELFYANQFEPTDVNWIGSGGVKNIIVAKDDVIWVSTKLSVFRFIDNGEEEATVEEYNYFRAPEKFPSRTHMVYRVLETPDGRIWAVCSDEGHLSYKGIYLRGGLLQWNEGKKQFEKLETTNNYASRGFNWFITSITPTGKDKAIVGTLGGFAEYDGGEIRDYYALGGGIKNSSYDAIYENRPSLFMGTRGDNLGDLWLFGSAAGITAYRNGVWMYPDRLNQMLPNDQEFGNYGSRHVNAIATDSKGRIYAGTDLGLLIYDSQGADPMSFLINNGSEADAFSAQNEIQLQEERSSVIKSIPKSSSSGKIITELDDIESEIRRLQQIKASSQQQILGRGEGKEINSDSLTTLIADRNKKHYELLLKLEKQDPAIHQLLDVKPVEVATLRKSLGDGECLVQYIPTARKLYIQVLAKDKIELREVLVNKDTLMRMSQYVANGIKYKMGMEELEPRLEWLYDQLLRPIKNDISSYQHVMVIPVQSLYYIPFAALMDRTSSKGSAYALEQFNMAYVSSTYLLGLLLKTNVEATDRYLLFGDPDGSLPGAGEEVKAISQITASNNVFTNKQATISNLMKNASGSRVVHLATHGYLNERSPEESSILLADNKLTMPQIFNLPLDKTDMIVLSACETGKGASKGMEYATIARAFANAGSPSVLATLWKVDDSATRELMVGFYGELKNNHSKLASISNAQRMFLKEQKDKTHPYYWAAFILMGKP